MNNIDINNFTYNSRAVSRFQNMLLRIRAWFYEKEIVKSLFEMMGKQKSSGLNLDIGCGAGHKTEVILRNLVNSNGKLIGVEPSDGMRKVAENRLTGKNIILQKGDSSNLSDYNGVENIFCNQMTHHLDEKGKKEFFINACNSLVIGGRIIILDTTIPEGKFLKFIFLGLKKIYGKYVGKGNSYHNITTQEYIDLLQEAGFEVDIKFTRHFYLLGKIGEIGTKLGILYPFITQIVAKKI